MPDRIRHLLEGLTREQVEARLVPLLRRCEVEFQTLAVFRDDGTARVLESPHTVHDATALRSEHDSSRELPPEERLFPGESYAIFQAFPGGVLYLGGNSAWPYLATFVAPVVAEMLGKCEPRDPPLELPDFERELDWGMLRNRSLPGFLQHVRTLHPGVECAAVFSLTPDGVSLERADPSEGIRVQPWLEEALRSPRPLVANGGYAELVPGQARFLVVTHRLYDTVNLGLYLGGDFPDPALAARAAAHYWDLVAGDRGGRFPVEVRYSDGRDFSITGHSCGARSSDEGRRRRTFWPDEWRRLEQLLDALQAWERWDGQEYRGPRPQPDTDWVLSVAMAGKRLECRGGYSQDTPLELELVLAALRDLVIPDPGLLGARALEMALVLRGPRADTLMRCLRATPPVPWAPAAAAALARLGPESLRLLPEVVDLRMHVEFLRHVGPPGPEQRWELEQVQGAILERQRQLVNHSLDLLLRLYVVNQLWEPAKLALADPYQIRYAVQALWAVQVPEDEMGQALVEALRHHVALRSYNWNEIPTALRQFPERFAQECRQILEAAWDEGERNRFSLALSYCRSEPEVWKLRFSEPLHSIPLEAGRLHAVYRDLLLRLAGHGQDAPCPEEPREACQSLAETGIFSIVAGRLHWQPEELQRWREQGRGFKIGDAQVS